MTSQSSVQRVSQKMRCEGADNPPCAQCRTAVPSKLGVPRADNPAAIAPRRPVKPTIHTPTGRKLAIKIVPRVSTNTFGTPLIASQSAKAQAKAASKEIRHILEAALSMLLHRPYICGMREIITHPGHFYTVSEYVDDGQMLDYIISHGRLRLRERAPRKSIHQTGVALEHSQSPIE